MSRFDGSTLARAMAAVLPTPRPPAVDAASGPPAPAPGLSVMDIAERLAVQFEGVYLRPYLCPRGIPTIGVGATFYEDGRRVTLLDAPITRERAMALLRWHLARYFLPQVQRLCPGADTPPRLAALLDFAFNLGTGNLAASTLRRRVNLQAWDQARAEHLRWNKAGGRVLTGLERRCAARASLT